MQETIINQELRLAYPEGFAPIDREELDRLYQDENHNRWGIRDRDRHVIVTVFWHRTNALLVSLADAKSIAKATEGKLRRGLKQHGYQFEGFFPTEVCGVATQGFRYSYRVEDVDQVGEIIILKRKAVCYTLYYYARKESALEGYPLFEEILRSLSFQ